MNVVEVFRVRGRGWVAVLDKLPRGANANNLIGCLVHQGERAWKVTGVEVGLPHNKRVGMYVRALDGGDPPEKGPLEL